MLEIDFKEPTLKTAFLIHNALEKNEIKELEQHLLETHNLYVYEQAIEKGLLKHSEKIYTKITKASKEEFNQIEAKLKNELDQETIHKEHAQFYAKIMDLPQFDKKVEQLLELDKSISLKMDVFLCRIRMGIILGDKTMLCQNIESATELSNVTDWDRKNRFKVYLGIYNLMKGDFKAAATFLYESLASFEATELFDFKRVILYLIFSGLLGMERSELEEKIVANSEVLTQKQFLGFAESFYYCDYSSCFQKMLEFIELFKDDPFIGCFDQFFCKEMKVKAYAQFLLSYQSVHMDKMAQCFGITPEHLEEDIRIFVIANKLSCAIDKIDNIIIVKGVECDGSIDKNIELGSGVLREIRKRIN